MVWPIIRSKSYVGETGKSMKVGELAGTQEGGWRYIAVTLKTPQRALWPDFNYPETETPENSSIIK
jgi:hypothetical protein